MPIYEYRCQACHWRFSQFVRGFALSEAIQPVCPRCHGSEARRLVSRFAVVRGEESHMEDLTDPTSMGGFDENDPVSIARYARKMGQELGEEMPPEFDEVVDRLESGQSPEEVEHELGMGEDGSVGGAQHEHEHEDSHNSILE
jgi:putative FmdB family regulatory protein